MSLSLFDHIHHDAFLNTRETPARKPQIRLDIGPARAESAIPPLGFLKFLGSMGTGFAQPKPNKNKHKAPMGSTCAKGLKVSLPRL